MRVTRREAVRRLGAMAAGAAALGAGCRRGAALGEGGGDAATEAGRALGPLGVQLYTLRSEMERDVGATLARVAEIGYREVEFAGYFGKEPAEIRRLLDAAGLVAPAAHVAPDLLDDRWTATLEDAAVVGHRWLVVAWIPEPMRSSLDAWRRTAERFDRAGERAREHGLRFAYHNHDFEFEEMEGRVAFDVFCEATDPELVQIELDLFWITHGGGDPVAFMERWPGRVPMVHVKDRTPAGDMVDVGRGSIDWERIFRHREVAGTRHLFVEHDRPEDPFASVARSFAYLDGLRVG